MAGLPVKAAHLARRPLPAHRAHVSRRAAAAAFALAGVLIGAAGCANFVEVDELGYVGSGGGNERFDVDSGEGQGGNNQGGGNKHDGGHPDGGMGQMNDDGGGEELPDAGPDAPSVPDATPPFDAGGGDGGDAQASRDGAADAAPDAARDAAGDSGPDGATTQPQGEVDIRATVTVEKIGSLVACPGISVFSVNPAELARGQTSQLTVATIGPLAEVAWTVIPTNGGKFSDPKSFTPTFLCNGQGTMNVTVQAGPASGGSCVGVRYTSYSVPIRCE